MNRRILGGEEAFRFAVLPEGPDRWARFVTLRKQSATVWKPIGGMTGAAPRHRDVPATAAPDPPRPAPHRSETQLRERRRGRPPARDRRKRAPWSRDTAESFRGFALLLENVTRGPFPEPAASIPFRPGNGFLCAALPEPRVEGAPLLMLQSAEPEASSRAAASWPTRSPICPAPSPKPSRAGRCVKFSPRPAFRVGRIFVILKSIRARNTGGPFCVPGRWRWPSFPDAAARRTGRPRAPSARPPARKTDRLRTRCPGGAGRPSRTRPRSRSQDVFVFCS